MIAAAETAGVRLMTAYRLHNEPGTLFALDRVRDGAIGEARLFSSTFSLQAASGNHRLKAAHWGGPLQDIGVYCLNAVRHFFEAEPIDVRAMRNAVDDPRFSEVEETIAATLMFPKGRIAQFCASFGAADLDVYRIVGTAGEIAVEQAYDFKTPTRVRIVRGGEIIEHTFPQVDQFAGQIDYFSDCIATGARPEADGEEGLADVRVLRALERSAATGAPQTVNAPARPRHPEAGMARAFTPTDRRLML